MDSSFSRILDCLMLDFKVFQEFLTVELLPGFAIIVPFVLISDIMYCIQIKESDISSIFSWLSTNCAYTSWMGCDQYLQSGEK